MSAPPADAIAAIQSAVAVVTRRATVFEADGMEEYIADLPLGASGGSVSIDASSDSRRTLALAFYDEDGEIDVGTDGLWYDKVIQVWRGVEWTDESGNPQSWETSLGVFKIDNIRQRHHPHTVIEINGRDMSKSLGLSKFGVATTFAAGYNVVELIEALALNAGVLLDHADVPKLRFTSSSVATASEMQFNGDDSRWKAMLDLAVAHDLELFFDAYGYLVLRHFKDPTTSSLEHTFAVGTDVASYDKLMNDSELYNRIVVVGENSEAVPVFAEALNDAPSSPTRVDRIGERTKTIVSSYVETAVQAQEYADSLLAVAALESFELNWGTLVVPSLDVTEIVEFVDPHGVSGQPTRFYLTGVTIPLNLAPMTSIGKRLQVVT